MKSKFRLSRRANNSDYSLEDILAMDDDMLNLYITINNLDAESGAKVLEAVQYRPKYPRRVSVSVRASYPRRIVRGELCSERLWCPILHRPSSPAVFRLQSQRSSDGDFFQLCFVWGASAQHNTDQSTHRESQCQSAYHTDYESEF